jgi:hypothetical protein
MKEEGCMSSWVKRRLPVSLVLAFLSFGILASAAFADCPREQTFHCGSFQYRHGSYSYRVSGLTFSINGGPGCGHARLLVKRWLPEQYTSISDPSGGVWLLNQGSAFEFTAGLCGDLRFRLLTLHGRTRIEQSANPPQWVRRRSGCVLDLTSPQDPSGIAGYLGYNVSELRIVTHAGTSCDTAKQLAYSDWLHGPRGQPLRWRYMREWRTTSGGSAYVGDFVGKSGGRQVEYYAIH